MIRAIVIPWCIIHGWKVFSPIIGVISWVLLTFFANTPWPNTLAASILITVFSCFLVGLIMSLLRDYAPAHWGLSTRRTTRSSCHDALFSGQYENLPCPAALYFMVTDDVTAKYIYISAHYHDAQHTISKIARDNPQVEQVVANKMQSLKEVKSKAVLANKQRRRAAKARTIRVF